MQTRTLDFRGVPYKIVCFDTFAQHPSWYSFEDEHEVRMRQWAIEPGDVVLDIGAAYGSYTLTALTQGASRIYAWSPQGPKDEELEKETLRKSLELNGWTDRCTVYGTGIFSESGWLDVNTQQVSPDKIVSPDVIEVEPLDAWRNRTKLERIDWVKLDVEGAEVEVLKSGARTIREFRPKIQVENHLFKRASIEQEVRDLLISWNYREIQSVPYHSVSHSVYHPRT